MTPDVGTLTNLLQSFELAFKGGYLDIQGHALSLLAVLVAIEITFLGLFGALKGGELATPFIKKLLAIGFFSWVVLNFDWLTNEVLLGFTSAAQIAANTSAGPAISDPSAVIELGFTVTSTIFDYVRKTQDESWIGFAFDTVIAAVSACIILFCFYLVALQVFITRLEFTLLTSLSIILIPFGVFKHTSFLAEKTFGGILSFGIKLMVLTFLISIALPLLTQYSLPPDPTWDEMLNMVFVAFTFMYLCWHAPSVTAGLLTGGPSLSGMGLASTGVQLAGGMVGAAAGAALGGALSGAKAFGGSVASGSMAAMKAAVGALSVGGGGDLSGIRSLAGGLVGAGDSSSGVGESLAKGAQTTGRAVKASSAPSSQTGTLKSAREATRTEGSEGRGTENANAAVTAGGTGGSRNSSSQSKPLGGPRKENEKKEGDGGNFEQNSSNRLGKIKAAAKAGIRDGARSGLDEARRLTPSGESPLAGLSVPLNERE